MRVLAVLQIKAELRKQPGVMWPERKTPDGSRRTACITGFAVPFAFAAKRRYL